MPHSDDMKYINLVHAYIYFYIAFLPTMVLIEVLCVSLLRLFSRKIPFSWKQKFTFSLKVLPNSLLFFFNSIPSLNNLYRPYILKKDQWFMMCAGFEPSTSRLRDKNVSARLQGLSDLQRTFRSSDCFFTVTIMRSIGHTYRINDRRVWVNHFADHFVLIWKAMGLLIMISFIFGVD